MLFIVENQRAKPSTEALMLYPFKDIWERDDSSDKGIAIKELSYIEFMCSPKKTNPFFGYSEEDRHTKIVEFLFNLGYTPDGLVQEGMRVYKDFFYNASPSLSFLESAREGAEKLKKFFSDFDLNEKNDKGVLLYKPKDITTALMDTFNILRTLNSLEEKVYEEIYESTKSKGNREINPFER